MVTQESSNSGDLHALTALIARAAGDDPGPIVPWSLLHDLAALIPADEVSIAELDMRNEVREVQQGVIEQNVRCEIRAEQDEPDAHEIFWKHYESFWAGAAPSRAGQVRRMSDWHPARELHANPLYEDFFRPDGVKYFLSLGFPTAAGHERNLLFFRHSGPDFSDREKNLLQLLRPHLIEIHANAARRRLGALTPREWQVLELAAEGHSNAAIAALLFTSVSTVRKHMEHIFDHAGVRNRSAAVARMMPDYPRLSS